MRVSGMTMHKLPLFVWAVLITHYYYYYLYQFSGGYNYVINDRNFNTTFYDPAGGGDLFYINIYFGFLVIQKFIF